MPLSRHSTIAQDVVEFVDSNWSQKPSNVQVIRARSFETATNAISTSENEFVCVIVPDVQSSFESRGSDRDRVPVFVVIVASIPGLDETILDEWDERSEQIFDVLRDRRLNNLTINSTIHASRTRGVSMPTTADAEWLYESEIFVSVIEMEYSYSVPLSEVA